MSVSSGSYRPMVTRSAPRSRPVSSATAPNTPAGGSPCATKIATRRSAACSSASCWADQDEISTSTDRRYAANRDHETAYPHDPTVGIPARTTMIWTG